MGTGCSKSVVVISNTSWNPHNARPSQSSASHTSSTKCSGSTIKTLAEAAIWSPFKLSRSEAEELLSQAEPGAFVFSHDMTSELFLSICAGKYVCHHAVLTRDQGYYVGARRFTTIGAVVDYFKDHPLGETTLKQEFRALNPRITSQVQVKQHPDFTISCPAQISTNGHPAGEFQCDQSLSILQTSVGSKTNQSQSPKIMLTSHLSGKEKTPSEDDGQVLVTMNTDGQQPPRCAPWNDTLTKKQLTRSMAIERTDSSGEIQETALSPLLPTRSSVIK